MGSPGDEEDVHQSPFVDQSYNSLSTNEHSFYDGDVNNGGKKSTNRVFSDESFRSAKLPDNHSFDNSDYESSTYYPTPKLNVDSRFNNGQFPSPNVTSPNSNTFGSGSSTSRRPSLRFKLPGSSVNDNVDVENDTKNAETGHDKSSFTRATSPFMDKNVILEDEVYNIKQESPFEDNVVEFPTIEKATQPANDNYDYDESQGLKRHRWGTTRNKKGKPKPENVSRSKTIAKILKPPGLMRQLSSANSTSRKNTVNSRSDSIIRGPNTNSAIIDAYDSTSDEDEDDGDDSNKKDDVVEADPKDRKDQKRSIVLNQHLPLEYLDDKTGKPSVSYPRNKIRTTKYTPLTFIPINISNQFLKNVANIYFLVLIILGFFEIFGVPSPFLAMVPLIVIVVLTAIRDAVEDSRRTNSDLEVNNQPTHILTDMGINDDYKYENLNLYDEKISLWRRFKKACSRLVMRLIHSSKENLTKKGKADKIRRQNEELGDDNPVNIRKSFDSDIMSRHSTQSENPFLEVRKSFQSGRKSFQSGRKSQSHRPKSLKFSRKLWKDVRVGDVLRIYNNEEIPADVILLSTSDEDNGCYVETKNLDGETNLKVKQSLKYGNNHKITKGDDLIHHKFQIDSEGPHPNLFGYQGNLKYEENGELAQESITINNLLLRGCTLRNTKWAIGITVFTGSDSKIMINSGITPSKQSRISKQLNYYVIANFVLLFIICFLSGLINGLYYDKTEVSRDYFEFGTIMDTSWKNGIISCFVALILYQSLVPISLYITIELIKSAQAFFIYSDVNMYYDRLDFPCTPKSWSISDDLGQIEYVFSDKTGTLTQNVMEFKKCTINGVSYGKAYTEALAGLRKRQGIDVESEANIEKELIERNKEKMLELLYQSNPNNKYTDELTFVSKDFVNDVQGGKGDLQKKSNEHFMLALALCHSVLAEKDDKSDKLELKAQSPDEAALVGTARSLGFAFKGATKTGFLVDIQGVTKEYQILNTLEFNSTRKRMSALVKIPGKSEDEEPKVLLICKGADSIIYGRLSKRENEKSLLNTTSKHLEQFATEGLRTLCIAQREISWLQYLEWNRRHQEAASSLEDREDKMEEVADSIERELVLLGGTAIEDRLQDGVPDSISLLGEAGIKLWVLTGDKVETAINIGFSCNLLGNEMELLIIKPDISIQEKAELGLTKKSTSGEIVDSIVTNYLQKHFNMEGSPEELEAATMDHSPPLDKYGVIIDGDALKLIFNNKDMKRRFLLLCKQCRAVLCCRVSPSQKAGVVRLVKDTLNVMTLAIGDGSNDVAMIQSAHIGVGIAGEEGRQAVMSSDYAIGQFRFLSRLLLTHGRWAYKRFSEMIPSFFYKNVIFTIALFWYGLYNDFDGSYLFEFTYLMFYNLAFTSLPVIFLGILDQDVSAKVSMLVPELYRSGILQLDFKEIKFWIYMVDGIYQSVISFFFPYLMYYKAFPSLNGLPIDHRFWVGIVVTSIACISCNFYILLHQYRWDWWSVMFIWISIIIIYFWTGVWTTPLYSQEFYKAAEQMFGVVSYWACTFIGVLICLIPRFLYDVLLKFYYPSDVDVIRECVDRGDFDKYPEDYDPTDPNRVKIDHNEDPDKSTISGNESPNYSSSSNTKVDSVLERQMHLNSSSTVMVGNHSQDSLTHNGTSQSSQIPQTEQRKSVLNMFKRKSHAKSFYDNSSFIDGYNQSHAGTSDDLVETEEIAMTDFDQNAKRASRISSDNRGVQLP